MSQQLTNQRFMFTRTLRCPISYTSGNRCTSFLSSLQSQEVHVNKTPRCVLSHFSRVRLCVTLWTVARQAPLSMGCSRQEYWSGLPCPPPGDLPDPGIEPMSLTSPALAGEFFTTSATWEALCFSLKITYLISVVNSLTWNSPRPTAR